MSRTKEDFCMWTGAVPFDFSCFPYLTPKSRAGGHDTNMGEFNKHLSKRVKQMLLWQHMSVNFEDKQEK